jgi:hypothetical protein
MNVPYYKSKSSFGRSDEWRKSVWNCELPSGLAGKVGEMATEGATMTTSNHNTTSQAYLDAYLNGLRQKLICPMGAGIGPYCWW